MSTINGIGLRAVEFNCIVLEDQIEEKSRGGIIIPEQTKERDQFATTTGLLISVAPTAFTYEQWPDELSKPKEGDRIVFAKYAGSMVKGLNGVEYRIIKDKDILAVQEQSA